MRRPCTELLKYLTASDDAFQTRTSEAKSTWSGCDKDRGGPGTSSCSSSSSPSSSSTSSFSSLSSCSSSTASKKKPSSASLSTQQHQQQQLAVQAQRGESQAAGAYSVAGEGAGQWRRCTHGEQSTPVVPSCGSGCSHACSSEEGRPLQCADTGSLAAARFIRYMHSYSLPPREMGRAGSCGRCLEAGGWAGASRANRHITITIRKRRQEREHPMLSQLLTSRPRPARYRAHLQMPSMSQRDKQDPPKTPPRDKGWDGHIAKDSQEHQIINTIPDVQEVNLQPLARASDFELSTLDDMDLKGLLMKFEQDVEGSKIKVGQNGVDVHDDVLGSPLSFPWGLPSPLFHDSLVPEHTPSTIQEQNPHRQADCRHPDDQVPPPLGNHCCIPALCLFLPLLL